MLFPSHTPAWMKAEIFQTSDQPKPGRGIRAKAKQHETRLTRVHPRGSPPSRKPFILAAAPYMRL